MIPLVESVFNLEFDDRHSIITTYDKHHRRVSGFLGFFCSENMPALSLSPMLDQGQRMFSESVQNKMKDNAKTVQDCESHALEQFEEFKQWLNYEATENHVKDAIVRLIQEHNNDQLDLSGSEGLVNLSRYMNVLMKQEGGFANNQLLWDQLDEINLANIKEHFNQNFDPTRCTLVSV